MRGLVLALGALLVTSVPALADYTYDYTGSYFTYIYGAPYTTSDRVTGTVTFAEAFVPGIGYYDLQPISFSFTDGVQTLTKENALSYLFNATTYESPNPATYNLESYDFQIYGSEFVDPYTSRPGYTGIDVDGSFDAGTSGGSDGTTEEFNGGVSETSGVLTLVNPHAVTPEPGSLALLGTGLLGLVGVVRRR